MSAHNRVAAVRREIRELWRLSWPMLIGQLATVGMGVSDVAMTGHVSAVDLAAVSLGASIWSIIIVTLIGLMMAVNTVVAYEVGAGKFARIPHVVRQAMWQALGVGIVSMIVANLCIYLFDLLSLEMAVREKASAFVKIVSFGLPAFAAYRALYGYSASLNHTKPMMLIALGGLCFNILVNWLLVYGHCGLPKLGAIGCAVATGIGMWLMLAAMIGWIRHSAVYRSTNPFRGWERPNWREIGGMLKLGLPIGIAYFAEISAFSAVCLLVARFGVFAMASNQIALNFASLVFMVPLSLGVGLITRVGQALGDGNPVRARFIAWVGVAMSLGFGLLSAISIALFRHQIAAAYTSDPEVRALTANLLLFAALFQLSDATQVAASSAIRGYKITTMPMLIHLAAFWGVSLPLGCILGLAPDWFPLPLRPAQPMAAAGFWIGLVIGLSLAASLLVRLLNRLSLQRVAASICR